MDKIIEEIQDLIQDAIIVLNSPIENIKNVYYGDPITIPISSLPAVAIHPISTEYILRGSRYDEKKHTIEIRVIFNGKTYFSDTPTNEEVKAVKDAILMIEETNNKGTVSNTICGIIQKNLNLNNSCNIAQVKIVNYTFSNDRGYATFEIIITVEARVIGDR